MFFILCDIYTTLIKLVFMQLIDITAIINYKFKSFNSPKIRELNKYKVSGKKWNIVNALDF